MITVLFVGGGTMGPVTPLIAVMRRMRRRRPDLRFAWAGTPDGPEREVLKREGVEFFPIPVAKLPRHPGIAWLLWPFRYLKARRVAGKVVRTVRPSLIASAGGFTGVPVIKAASLKGIPCAIHQLDAEPGLANKAVAASCASVTTSFRYDTTPFIGTKAVRVPTPCRFADVPVPSREDAVRTFGLDPERPVVFVVGGGTGAVTLNEALWSVLDGLLPATQVIHMTGKGKGDGRKARGYVQRDFLEESDILDAYAAADLVVSRAGIGSISDLAALSKPAIFVPLPGHQEKNVARLVVETVRQDTPDFAKRLRDRIVEGLHDDECRKKCGKRLHDGFPTDDGSALAERWLKLI
ncbi:glycosyltransferase [Candidatus Uhrbacteria bacterium]|nr:glycosyltransferase [Candidatus Uhrbacteria bacterium]